MAKEIATKTKLDTRIAADIAAAMPVANQPAAAKAVAAQVAKKAIVIDTEEVQAAVEQTVEGSADVIVAQAAGAATSGAAAGGAAAGMSTTALVVAGVAVAAAASSSSSSSSPAPAATTPTTPVTSTPAAPVAGTTFALTDKLDVTSNTANNDTYAASDTTYTTGDIIDGGAGNDTLSITLAGANTAIASVSNVETLKASNFHTAAVTVNLINYSGLNEVQNVSSTEALVFSNVGASVNKATLQNLSVAKTTAVTYLNSATTGTTDAFAIDLNGVTAAQTITVETTTANTGGIETFNVNSTGANSTGKVTLAGALQTGVTSQKVNVTGDKNLSIAVSDKMTTVDANALTGKLSADLTATANYTATGGSGDDKFDFGAAFTSSDKVNGGAGTDRIAVGNGGTAITFSTVAGDINAKTNNVNNVSAVEIFEYTGTAALALDASLITVSGLTGYATSGAIAPAQNTATTAAVAGWAVTNQANAQTFSIEGNITGQAGAANTGGAGNAGGAGITFAAAVNNASNVLNLTLKGVTVTGGAGGQGSATTNGGAGASAADFTGYETINITSSKAASGTATNAFVGGAAANGTGTTPGGGTAQANTILASANTVINVNGDNDIDFGLISNSNTSLTVNAKDLTGKMTVTTGTAADVITGGSGINLITLGGGIDEVNLSQSAAKADVITISAATNTTSTGFVKISGFTNSGTSTIGDKIDVKDANTVLAGTGTSNDMGAVLSGLTASLSASGILSFGGSSASTATLANKISVAFSTTFINNVDDKVLAFEHNGNTYVVKSDDTSQGFNAGTDSVIELTGLTGITALSATASGATTVFIV